VTTVMNVDGTDVTPLADEVEGDNGQPTWSQDGKKIVFSIISDTGGALAVMSAEGSDIKELRRPPGEYPGDADWSPDGRKIVFRQGPSDEESNLYVMNADGTGVRQLTSDAGVEGSPRWAPDGNAIAFWSDRDGGGFYTMKPDGTGVTRIAGIPIDARATFTWSPDGKRIAWVGGLAGEGNPGSRLFVMDADGSHIKAITKGEIQATNISWRASPST